ncbi:MAG: hypothetical protein ACRES4_06265, partial [Nevskiales bacterium]
MRIAMVRRGYVAAGVLLAFVAYSTGQYLTSRDSGFNEPVLGAASKGPLHDALVSFFPVDGLGNKVGSTPVGTPTNTDTAGNFSFTRPLGVTEALLLETSDGFFFDESDRAQKRKISFSPGQGL